MAKREYELLPNSAKHTLRDGTVLNPGDVIESETDLVARFPGKFRVYGEQVQKKAVKRKGTTEDGPKEVTEEFENAAEANVQVFKEGRKYLVTDADGEKLIEEPVTKAAVANLIEERLEGEGDGEGDE